MVRELPQVGRNLFDHLNVPVYVNLRERVSITLVKLLTVPEVFNYFAFGTGMWNNTPMTPRSFTRDVYWRTPRDRCCNSALCIPSFRLHVKGWLATNGVMGLGRANNSGLLLFGVASTEEKLLKAISNLETEVIELIAIAAYIYFHFKNCNF